MKKFFLKINGKKLNLSLLKLENAVIAFFFEEEAKLGTIAISLTPLVDGRQGPSSTIIGDRNRIAARLIAEKIAFKTSKIALVSVYVNMPESQILKAAIKLIKKI